VYWTAVSVRKPFCQLRDLAFILDISMNQAEKMWQSGLVPAARAANGEPFAPTAVKLVVARDLYEILSPDDRKVFDSWQLDEVEIPVPARGNRTTRLRSGAPAQPVRPGRKPKRQDAFAHGPTLEVPTQGLEPKATLEERPNAHGALTPSERHGLPNVGEPRHDLASSDGGTALIQNPSSAAFSTDGGASRPRGGER
jgi:hypothetical protein